MRRPIYHLPLAMGLALLCLTPNPAMAMNRTVTNVNDSGAGSLRQTIIDSASGDTIDFSANLSGGTITLTSGELLIGRSITITGPTGGLTVSGNNNSRVFHVSNGTTSGPTVNLANLTITSGRTSGSSPTEGAGIFNDKSTLTVNNCTVSGNSSNYNGGGISNSGTGTMTLTNCTISGNVANTNAAYGGGIYNPGTGMMTLTNCTISGNSSNFGGGGIASEGTATLTNCTISGNSTTPYFGGGIYNPGTMTLTNCTISGNTAGTSNGKGGGISSGHSLAILNTIIAGNSAPTDPDVYTTTPITSQGHNLIGKTDGSSGWVASDLTGTVAAPIDPQLGTLQNNGGPTNTMALQPTSAAVDAGDDSVLGPPLNLTTDQRGPGFPRKLGAHVDIGAFEADAPQSGPTFTVTTNADHDDGMCGIVDCTLREAINAANAAPGPNTITFAPGVTGTITLQGALGVLSITDSTTIIGPGARLLAVSGNGVTTVFSAGAGTSTISGLTIRDGMVTGSAAAFIVGGGILNSATLTLSDCTISGNQALGGNNPSMGGNGGDAGGGAIFNNGMLTLNRCTFSGNAASGAAGTSNSSGGGFGGAGGAGQGGAVFNHPSGSLAISNCTFNGNSATGGSGGDGFNGGNGGVGSGGAVFNLGTMTVTAATVSGNTGSGGAGGKGNRPINNGAAGLGNGGLAAGGGTSTVGDTISAGNSGNNGGGLDVAGTFTSNGYNFIGSGDHSNGFTNGANHDQVGTDAARINPQLGPLQNNGGPTDTMALTSNTPPTAVNTGDPNAPPQDQRYYLRSGVPDIGAFEFGGALAPVSAVSRKTHGTAGVFDINLPLTGTRGVECRQGGAANAYQVVFTFPTAVTINTMAGTQGAMVTSGTGSVSSVTGSGTTAVTVNLTGVIAPNPPGGEYLTVTLFGVHDGTNTNNVTATMAVLIGDVNANGALTNSDVSLVKAQVAAGASVGPSNFRDDINANGVLTNADVSLTKAQVAAGAQLPSPP